MLVRRVMDRALHEKTLRLGQTFFEGGSVYPFFRATGEVEYLMVVLPHKPRVFILPYAKGMINVHRWGAVSMDIAPDQLKALGDLKAKQLEDLFHYDSKWVLSDARFKMYWAREIIRKTNCAKTLRKQIGKEIDHLRFSRDVSRLESVALLSKGLKISSTLAADGVLKSLASSALECPERRAGSGNGQWVLDPVWQHWTAPGPD